jgi:hypothetical protein
MLSSCSDDEDTPAVPDLIGQFTWSEWQNGAGWADYSASDWTPNATTLDSMIQAVAVDDYSFIIFGSNWCHKDCEPQMPRIIKLLVQLGYDADAIEIWGLNRTKSEPAEPIALYSVKFVPTIVILKNGEHVGSVIAETDNINWESEMLSKMLSEMIVTE